MMTDLEKEKLRRFADDEVLVAALARALADTVPPFSYQPTMSNELIGALLRNHDTGIAFISGGLQKVQRIYRSANSKGVDKLNPAV